MISFKKFLEARERGYHATELNDDALVEAIKKNCHNAVAAYAMGQSFPIYRGFNTIRPSGILHPETGKRRSENTSNYYTLFLDTNPENAGWPKRSRSLIATTDRGTARNYAGNAEGEMMQLIPFDGTEVGVVNKPDIWRTKVEWPELDFKEGIEPMNRFFREFGDDDDDLTLRGMQAALRDPTNRDKVLLEMNEALSLPKRGMDPDETIKKFVDGMPHAYSYKSLGATKHKPEDVTNGHSEVWISGPVVAVTRDKIDQIAKEFGYADRV